MNWDANCKASLFIQHQYLTSTLLNECLWDDRNTSCEPGLLIQHQYQTSQMLFWLNRHKLPKAHSFRKPSQKSQGCNNLQIGADSARTSMGFGLGCLKSSHRCDGQISTNFGHPVHISDSNGRMMHLVPPNVYCHYKAKQWFHPNASTKERIVHLRYESMKSLLGHYQRGGDKW